MRRFLLLAVICYLIGSVPSGRFAWTMAGRAADPAALESALAVAKAGLSLGLSKAWVGADVSVAIGGASCITGMGSPVRWWLERRSLPGETAETGYTGFYPESPGPFLSALSLVCAVVDPRSAAASLGVFLCALRFLAFEQSAALAGLAFPLATSAVNGPGVQLLVGLFAAFGAASGLLGGHGQAALEDASVYMQRQLSVSIARHLYLGALLLGVGAYFLYLNRHVYRGFNLDPRLFVKGRNARGVALTFDDGPDPVWTPRILDVLKEHGVRATFFVVGKRVRAHPEVAWRIVREGHEIGSHSHSHRSFHRIGSSTAERELDMAEKAIVSATGVRPAVFRPPRGRYGRPEILALARSRGYDVVLWSLSSRDWAELSWPEIAGGLLRRVEEGDVILFHDSGGLLGLARGNRSNTVRALEAAIEQMKSRGLGFYTVSEMMALDVEPAADLIPDRRGWLATS